MSMTPAATVAASINAAITALGANPTSAQQWAAIVTVLQAMISSGTVTVTSTGISVPALGLTDGTTHVAVVGTATGSGTSTGSLT